MQVVEVETAAGDWTPALAPPDIEARLNTLSAPTSRLRIINTKIAQCYGRSTTKVAILENA